MAGTSAIAIKSALVAVLSTLYAPETPAVQVTYGMPGTWQGSDIVAVTDIDTEISRPTMGTARSREEESSVTVVVSVFRSGTDADLQQNATERAYALADLLQQRFRTAPNETLGGACREAWVSNMSLQEADDPEIIAKGRSATVIATVMCRARI